MSRIRIQHKTRRGVKIKTVYTKSQFADFMKKCFKNKWYARAVTWIRFEGKDELYKCGAVYDHEEAGLGYFYDETI
jgi:hypothetical protein